MALSKGLLAPVGGVTPSVWSGKTTAGLLGGSPLAPPMPTYQQYTPTGGTRYGNYVRRGGAALGEAPRTDIMAGFRDPRNTISNIVDFGKAHWTEFGKDEGRYLGPRSGVNPAISLGDTIDLGPAAVGRGTSGLPMPDVEGYTYVYPRYEWDNETGYAKGGVKSYETDITAFPHFPYMPETGGAIFRDKEGKDLRTILMGHQLVPDSWLT